VTHISHNHIQLRGLTHGQGQSERGSHERGRSRVEDAPSLGIGVPDHPIGADDHDAVGVLIDDVTEPRLLLLQRCFALFDALLGSRQLLLDGSRAGGGPFLI
jgi:hypothetical protein